MYWNQHDMSGWGWFTVSISSVLLCTLLITVAVLLFRALTRVPDTTGRQAASPEQLLAERFARGQIDEEEYRGRLGVLRTEGSGLTKH